MHHFLRNAVASPGRQLSGDKGWTWFLLTSDSWHTHSVMTLWVRKPKKLLVQTSLFLSFCESVRQHEGRKHVSVLKAWDDARPLQISHTVRWGAAVARLCCSNVCEGIMSTGQRREEPFILQIHHVHKEVQNTSRRFGDFKRFISRRFLHSHEPLRTHTDGFIHRRRGLALALRVYGYATAINAAQQRDRDITTWRPGPTRTDLSLKTAME